MKLAAIATVLTLATNVFGVTGERSWQAIGSGTYAIFNNKSSEPNQLWPVSFTLGVTSDHYAIRVHTQEPKIDRKLMVVSNYLSTYEAEKISRARDNKPKAVAFANFISGSIPDKVGPWGWSAPQALALAAILVDKKRAPSANILPTELVPEFFARRAQQHRMNLQQRILRNTDGAISGVQFWATRREALMPELNSAKDAALIGTIAIEQSEDGNLSEIVLTNNGLSQGQDDSLVTFPLSILTLVIESHSVPEERLFTEASTDQASTTAVNDYRFGGKPIAYSLYASDTIPFEGSRKFVEIDHLRGSIVTSTKAENRKRIVIAALFGVSCAGCVLLISTMVPPNLQNT